MSGDLYILKVPKGNTVGMTPELYDFLEREGRLELFGEARIPGRGMVTDETASSEWSFEVGDVVANGRGDEFEITKRLIDADTGERYYRQSHVSIDATTFDTAENLEERHELANAETDRSGGRRD